MILSEFLKIADYNMIQNIKKTSLFCHRMLYDTKFIYGIPRGIRLESYRNAMEILQKFMWKLISKFHFFIIFGIFDLVVRPSVKEFGGKTKSDRAETKMA